MQNTGDNIPEDASKDDQNGPISNQNLHETVFFDGNQIAKPDQMQILVNFYALTESDYHILVEGRPKWLAVSSNSFYVFLGILLPIAGRILGDGDPLKDWEIFTLLIGGAIPIVTYFLDKKSDNPQKRLKKKIENKLKIRHE